MKADLVKKILSSPEIYGSHDKAVLDILSEKALKDIMSAATGKAPAAKKSNVDIAPTTDKKVTVKKAAKSEDYIIKFEGIKKSFKEKRGMKHVHKDVSFNVIRGETVALIGANGAGKTVLMETLVRVQKQDEGKITYDFQGLDPFNEIGMQFQDADSTGNSTPEEMVKFITKMYGSKVDKAQTAEMIDIYGIRSYYKKKIKKLSGGQRQRVNLLLATMHNPKLMILDEFITGLDILSVRDILEYIDKLKTKNDATLIIISHQPDEIRTLAQRIFVLKDGYVEDEYLTADVEKKYNGNFTNFLLEVI